jgi:hypothetical protein
MSADTTTTAHPLAWITACPRSGSNSLRILIASYLLDAGAAETSADALLEVAPDFATLFSRGRTVTPDGSRPRAVKTDFLPSAEVLAPYREQTGRVIHLVRDPRALIATSMRRGPMDRERLRAAAAEWVTYLREWTSPERVRAFFPHVDGIHVLRFEDLREDQAAALHAIVGFLFGGEVDEGRVARAAAAATPEALRELLLSEAFPGLRPFRDLPSLPAAETRPRPPDPGVEDACRGLLSEHEEFAELVRRFGYDS